MAGSITSTNENTLTNRTQRYSPIKVTFTNTCGRKIHLAVKYFKSYNEDEPDESRREVWEVSGFYTIKNKQTFTISSLSTTIFYYADTDRDLFGDKYIWSGENYFNLYGESYGFRPRSFSKEYEERKARNDGSALGEPYIIKLYKP